MVVAEEQDNGTIVRHETTSRLNDWSHSVSARVL